MKVSWSKQIYHHLNDELFSFQTHELIEMFIDDLKILINTQDETEIFMLNQTWLCNLQLYQRYVIIAWDNQFERLILESGDFLDISEQIFIRESNLMGQIYYIYDKCDRNNYEYNYGSYQNYDEFDDGRTHEFDLK